MARISIIGVMGSGTDSYPELARPVGRLAARLGCHLLTGGGSGVMDEVSRAFCETVPRAGLSIGILKGRADQSLRDGQSYLRYTASPPNPWIELPIRTHLPLSGDQGREPGSRNHINVLSSDILIALPGGPGTLSEVMLRLSYGRNVILFLGGYRIDDCSADYFTSQSVYRHQVTAAETVTHLESIIREQLDNDPIISNR